MTDLREYKLFKNKGYQGPKDKVKDEVWTGKDDKKGKKPGVNGFWTRVVESTNEQDKELKFYDIEKDLLKVKQLLEKKKPS